MLAEVCSSARGNKTELIISLVACRFLWYSDRRLSKELGKMKEVVVRRFRLKNTLLKWGFDTFNF